MRARPVALALGVGLVAAVVGLVIGLALLDARDAAPRIAPREGPVERWWPNGVAKLRATYRHDMFEGEYRTWYESGAPFELRHYVNGREEGLQQSWTESGELYLNYEVRNGRRFGLVNASPCNVVGDQAAQAATRQVAPADPGRDAPADARPRTDESRPPLPYYESAEFTPRWHEVAHRVAAFTVRTQTGATLSGGDLRGRPYVASFIYTQCAAVCPLLVRQLTRVQRAIEGTNARIVSFSVTPESDTPEVLAAFGRERGIDPAIWSLVTGSKRTIYTLARTSFFADDARVGTAVDDATAFLHTEKLILVDGEGHVRGVYNGTQPHAVDQLTADLAVLLGNGSAAAAAE